MAEPTVVGIRKSVRRCAFAALIALDVLLLVVLVAAPRTSFPRWLWLAVLLIVVAAVGDWALWRLAASRIEIDDREVVLRYAFYPVVRTERPLVDGVEVVESGGLFAPAAGLSRSRRHLPVLVLAGGTRIPVPMCSRRRPAAAEGEAIRLRAALAAHQGW